MLNNCTLVGRVTEKPEAKTSGGDKKTEYAKFRLAVDRDFEEGADFFPCVAFGANAKFLDNYVEKGQQIAVQGRLKNNTWEDDKGRHTVTEIVAEKVYFAGSGKKSAASVDADANINEFI